MYIPVHVLWLCGVGEVEQATGVLADVRQAETLRQEAQADEMRVSALAREERAVASRLALEAKQASEAAAEAERYAEAARLGRLLTAEQVDEAKSNAERLSNAAEAARAKGRAAAVERIRAEDSLTARQQALNGAVQRLRLTQTFTTGVVAILSYCGLTGLVETAQQAAAGGSAPQEEEDGVGRQRSAPEIFRRGVSNLVNDPHGWFYGAPSALYSSEQARGDQKQTPTSVRFDGSETEGTLSATAEESREARAAPHPAITEEAGIASTTLLGEEDSEATRDSEANVMPPPDDPTARQRAIGEGVSVATYLARRRAGIDAAPSPPAASPPPTAPATTSPPAAPDAAGTWVPLARDDEPAWRAWLAKQRANANGRVVPTTAAPAPATPPATPTTIRSSPRDGSDFSGGESTRDPAPTDVAPRDSVCCPNDHQSQRLQTSQSISPCVSPRRPRTATMTTAMRATVLSSRFG